MQETSVTKRNKQLERSREPQAFDGRLALLLEAVAAGDVSVGSAVNELRALPFADLGFARVDKHRWLRQNQPEFVYAPGKTLHQLTKIVETLLDGTGSVVVTRLPTRRLPALRKVARDRGLSDEWHPGTGLFIVPRDVPPPRGDLLILTAGTSDLPVAQEAEAVARLLGAHTQLIADVGVAGLHRLLAQLPAIMTADGIIVVAGMEGALPSVVAGMAPVPVIACPTSVGYGANLGGVTALHSMLSSCAPGVAVVNIDDGIGAGTVGAMMVRLAVA